MTPRHGPDKPTPSARTSDEPRPRRSNRAVASRHLRNALPAATFLTAALLTQAGCAGPGASAPLAPVPTPSVTNGVEELRLPIEAFMLTPAQAVDYDWLRQATTGDCMRRYNQAYRVPLRPAKDSSWSDRHDVLSRRYGISHLEIARKWGYHPRSDIAVIQGAEPETLGQLPQDAQTVLMGTNPRNGQRVTSFAGKRLPVGGCLAELDRLLPGASGGPAGPAGGGEGIVTTIKATSFADSQTDPRVVAAIASWSGCMTTHGYNVTAPLKASDPFATAAGPASTQEIEQAQADVACKQETNVIGVWFAVESDLQNQEINKNSTELGKVKRTLAAESKTLAKLLKQDWPAPQPAS